MANFVRKTDFDDKVKNLNKNFTLNKTKHALVENRLINQKKLKQYQQKD